MGIKSLHLLLIGILIVTQLTVISYETIPQYWCRSNKNATGKGSGDYTIAFVIVGCAEGLPEGKGLWVYWKCDYFSYWIS